MNYHWDWAVFYDISADGTSTYLQNMFAGMGWTIATAIVSTILALAIGVVVGLMRVSQSRSIRALGAAYVEVFRDIPLLVQMFVWFFVVPELLPNAIGTWIKGLTYGAFITAALSLGLYAAARVAEQTRAAIQALPNGQLMAALALGLKRSTAFHTVILPQALRIIVPPLTSEIVNIVKNTSLGMTIGMMELTARAREMQESSFHTFEAFLAATAGYLAINLVIISVIRLSERRLRKSKKRAPIAILNQEVLS